MVVFSVTLFSMFKSDKFSPNYGFSSKIDFVKCWCQLQFLHCGLKFELLLSTQPGGFSYNCTKTAVVTLSRWYHALSSNKYFHIPENFQMPWKLLLQHRGKGGLPLSQVHRISWSETSNTQVFRPLKIQFVSRPNIDDCDFLQWEMPGWFLLPQCCSNPYIECLHQGRNHPYEQRGDRKNYPSREFKTLQQVGGLMAPAWVASAFLRLVRDGSSGSVMAVWNKVTWKYQWTRYQQYELQTFDNNDMFGSTRI